MRFAICNETYQDWDFARTCADVAECGYGGIEIAPFTLAADPSQWTPEQAEQAGRQAREAGLDVVGLHWLLVQPEGLHVTTADQAVRTRTTEFLVHLAECCAAAGGEVMVFGSPKQRNVAEGQTCDDCRDRAVEVFRRVAEAAGDLGVMLALEPLGAAETNFLVTAAETCDVIRLVDHPACRLHLDVKAMAQEEATIPQIIAAGAAELAHFHANDANRRGPGFGEVDFVPIASALADVGYDGWVSVEVFDYKPDPQTIARESLAYLRQTFARVGEG